MDDSSAQAAAIGLPLTLLYLAIAVLGIVALWKIFTKAGEPGWASIIPFYNIWVLVRIAGLGPLWFVLLLIPFLNIVAGIYVLIKLGEAFGKSVGWSVVFLIILSLIGYLILGFGSDQYRKPQLA